ncbi:Serine aminopeptidase [Phytophthora infestans]|uniref:Serine aminopeptidase n=1 Tax=Phytophthora infestans TaxID=4787 RepID=A0A833S1Y3_PHYIN|nr:Serine aminopeptidase [Phytophthora infestans]KAF4135029.1 Serine aminopeptidase [Phytophthora infestans]
MPNCRKLPQGASSNSRALAMSVIEEEPAHMRESRLEDQEKHPEDIKPSRDEEIDGRPRPSAAAPATTCPISPASGSESATCTQPRSASSSASTAPSSVDERYERYSSRNSRGYRGPPRSSKVESRPNCSSESRLRPHSSSSSRPVHDPRHDGRSSLKMYPEYSPHSKSSNSYEVNHPHHRPPRRHASPHSSSRPKSSSIPPDKRSVSTKRERAHRRTPSAPLSSPDEVPRTKLATRLDSIHASASQDVYDYHQRAASRQQASGPRSSSREKSQSKMLPPFREPFSERENTRSEAYSQANSAHPNHGHRHRRMSCQVSPTSSEENHRPKSPPSALASLSETELNEDRRVRAFQDVSPPPRQRSTSNPKPMSRTHIVTAQRRVASCRESKTPAAMNPKLMGATKSAKDHQQASSRLFLSSRDPIRTRSTSLLPKKSSKPVSSEGPMARSASASSLSSLGSAPSPRMSGPQMPLRLRHYEGRFSNRRKQTLFYFSLFPPEKMPMRGVVLALHGIGDHCRRNVKLYERLCREGFGVITYDLLNHGVSDLDHHKTRAHVSNFQYLVDDTNDFITFAKRSIYRDALRYWRKHHSQGRVSSTDLLSQPELPLIVAGTSFGSLVGLHTVLVGEHNFDAAVWGSPTVGVTWSPLLWAEAKLSKPLAAIIPTAKVVPAVQHDLLCRDPKFLKRFKADPLTSMDMMTTRTGHESLQAMIQLQENTRVTDPSSTFCAVPTLFLAGSADGISDQQAAIKFFGTMGNFDKEFKLFDGLFHMVYEEPEKEDVFRYLGKWLHRRFPVENRK